MFKIDKEDYLIYVSEEQYNLINSVIKFAISNKEAINNPRNDIMHHRINTNSTLFVEFRAFYLKNGNPEIVDSVIVSVKRDWLEDMGITREYFIGFLYKTIDYFSKDYKINQSPYVKLYDIIRDCKFKKFLEYWFAYKI